MDREAGGGRREADGSGLSPIERELVQWIEQHSEQQLAFLERVVNTDSATLNLAGVREVGRHFQQELDGLDFATRWASMAESMQRAGHLIAERAPEASEGKRVLLIGHLDTIYERHPFARSGDTVRGAGVSDMKGGDVALLFALKALHAAGMLERATVRVFLTGDEENPGAPTEVARRDLTEIARRSDVALSFESDSGKVAIGRRGLSTWSLEVTGSGGHSANVLRARRGAGAIYEAARILDRFREAFSGSPNITVNPGLFLGGTDVSYDSHERRGMSAGKFNVVARAATILGDLRFLTQSEREEAQAKMREIAASNLTKTSVRLSFDDMVPGWPASDGNRAVLEVIDRANRDLGYGPLEADDPGSRGFGDFNFIGSVIPGADGLGVRGRGEHGPEETMDLTSLLPCTARAAVVIARLLRST